MKSLFSFMFSVVLVCFVLLLSIYSYRIGVEKGRREQVNNNLETFYLNTQKEIKDHRTEIQNIGKKFGEEAMYNQIKEIVFKNFCEIPGVIDTVVKTKIVIK